MRNKKVNYPKILVGTPHSDVKNYCLDNYIKSVKGLTYPNYDILVVDNSETNKNTKYLRHLGIPTIHIKKGNKSTRQLIAESDERLRDTVLKGGYDFLLHFESDITPPPNVIEHLLSHRKEVVSAPYFINNGKESHILAQLIEEGQNGISETINLDKGNDFKFFDGKLKQVFACGTGMILIHRNVLKEIEFRYDENIDMHPDSFFANDIRLLGIPQFLDTSILCEHDNRDWSTIENK